MNNKYTVEKPLDGWRPLSSISDAERQMYRPIAETLAMMDGNAFFGNTFSDDDGTEREWFEMYLSEAAALVESNGGLTGWAGEVSFIK